MPERLNAILPDEQAEKLKYLAEMYDRTKTSIIVDMIDHWYEVTKEHEARGFHVVPLKDAPLSAAMLGDRAGLFDAGEPADSGAAAAGGGISTEIPRG
jgi:hypothetical protein